MIIDGVELTLFVIYCMNGTEIKNNGKSSVNCIKKESY